MRALLNNTIKNFLAIKPNIIAPPQFIRHFNIKIQRPQNDSKFSLIFKSFIFTAGFCGTSFTIATIFQYEREKYERSQFLISKPKKSFGPRNDLNDFWNSLSQTRKVVFGIIGINTLVFLAGLTPQFRNFIFQKFVMTTHSKNYSDLLLAAFNHNGALHFGINMFVLYSMTNYMENIIPPPEQFLAYYCSSAVFASFVSKSINLLMNRTIMSVGASGVLMSCFALISMAAPHAKFYIIPFPFPIEADMLLKGVAGLDLICLILGFTRIDHACHLGGLFYGLGLHQIGSKNMKQLQKKILDLWVKIRN